MKILTKEQICYIAGLFDGEGHCGVSRGKVAKGVPNYTVHVDITNTYKDVLLWAQETTGIGNVDPLRRSNTTWRPCWHWVLAYGEMIEFLPVVHPYLIIKHDQTGLVLEFLETCHGRVGDLHPPTIQEQAKREFLYWELRELNKRGN